MAVTFTTNLRLAVDSNLTTNAKANLAKIDNLGAVFLQDAAGNTLVRGVDSIQLLPNNASIGGTGIGGEVTFGSANQTLDSVTFYVTAMQLQGGVSLLDQATGGARYLNIQYNSTLDGSVDAVANRTLTLDLNNSNRSVIFGADLAIGANNLTVGGISYTLPVAAATLVDLDDAQTLSNKSLSGAANTFSAIPYSALVLSNSVTNSDINSSAAIDYSKLALSNSLVNTDVATGAAIAYSKLALNNSLVNDDIAGGAAIVYSKLALSNSIVNADISSSAAISYSKLALGNSLLNSDISSSAAISYSKLVLTNSILASDISASPAPSTNQILRYNGLALEWASVGSGTVTSVAASLSSEADAFLSLSGSPVTSSGTLAFDLDTQVANRIFSGPITGADAKPTFRALVSDDIPSLLASKISDYDTAWDTRLATKSTTNLTEGSNLYYTNGRVDTQLATYKVTATWAPGDGTTKAVTHSLGTTAVSWSIFDIDSGEEVWPDTATRTSVNAMSFASTNAPTGSGWTIVIRK